MLATGEVRSCPRSVSSNRNHCGGGFTIVELLVVIGIIGVLVAILLPAVQMAREASRRTQCQNNLRQIGIALLNFSDVHGKYPPGKKFSGPRDVPSTFSIAWSSYLLDYLEEQVIFDKIDFEVPFTDPVNLPATGQVISIYLCPSTSRLEEHRTPDGRLFGLGIPGDGMGCIDYLGVSGPDRHADNPASGEEYGPQRGVLIGNKGLPDEDTLIEPPPVKKARITDGLSKTMCVTECTGRGVEVDDDEIKSLNGAWASGANVSHISGTINETKVPNAWYKERIMSDHPGGVNILMCDGSVHFTSEQVDKVVVLSLCSRDGEEILDDLPF